MENRATKNTKAEKEQSLGRGQGPSDPGAREANFGIRNEIQLRRFRNPFLNVHINQVKRVVIDGWVDERARRQAGEAKPTATGLDNSGRLVG